MFKISLTEGMKNMGKNRLLTVLTVFLFAFLFLLQGYTYSYYAASELTSISSEHETMLNYHVYQLGFHGVSPRQVYYLMSSENLELETAEYFAEIYNSEHITCVGIRESGIPVSDFKGDIKIFADTEDWDKWQIVYGLKVTPNFYEVENYRVIKGRDFTAEDAPYVEGKPRPVLLGYKYLDVYEVGDIIDLNYEAAHPITQIEVIGFLAEDTTVMDRSGHNVYDLDNFIVYPEYIIPIEESQNYDREVIEYSLNYNYNYVWGFIKVMFSEEDEAEGLNEWRAAIDNYSGVGKFLTILDAKQIVAKRQSRYDSLASFFSEITAVLMFFSVITILISIVNRVSRNVKDYAIHVAVGATKKSAIAFILAEMSVILICSMAFGIFATKWMMHYINMPFYFWRFLGVYALTSVIILVLSAVITLISMRKYDVCTLIK